MTSKSTKDRVRRPQHVENETPQLADRPPPPQQSDVHRRQLLQQQYHHYQQQLRAASQSYDCFLRRQHGLDPSSEKEGEASRQSHRASAEYKTTDCTVYHNSMSGICGYCGKHNAKSFCSACRLAVYCNKECQRTHWKQHKPVCQRLSDVRAVAMAPLLQAPPLRNITLEERKRHADPVILVGLQIFRHFDARENDYIVYEHFLQRLLDEPIDIYAWSRFHVRSVFLTAKGIQGLLDYGVGVRVAPGDSQFRAYVAMTSLKQFYTEGPLIDLGTLNGKTEQRATVNGRTLISSVGQGDDEFTFRHPGTQPEDDEQVRHMGRQKPQLYAPIVTKASHHIKAVYFVHTNGFARIVAAYPNQISIRIDTARKLFVYDCYEYKPPRGAGRVRSHQQRHLPDVSLLHQFHSTVTCSPPAGIESVGGDAAAQYTVRKICHMKALAGEFFLSRCFRFCIPLAHICGIRLIQEDDKPQKHGYSTGQDSDTDRDVDGANGNNNRTASRREMCDIPGMLILEYNRPPDVSIHPFCSRTVATRNSRFEPIPDWTPGQHGSRATRHYICGAFLELQELAAYLCKMDDGIADLMAGDGGTLSALNIGFSKAPTFEDDMTIEPIDDEQSAAPNAFDGTLECVLECVKDRLRAMSASGNHLGAVYLANHLGLGERRPK